MSSPAGISGNCLFFIYVLMMSRPGPSIYHCLLGSENFRLLSWYFPLLPQIHLALLLLGSLAIWPKLDIPRPLHLCGISVTRTFLENPSRLIEHSSSLRVYYWQSSVSHSLKGRSCKTSVLIFLQCSTVAKTMSLHFISTAWKGRKITQGVGTVQFATRNLTTSSLHE